MNNLKKRVISSQLGRFLDSSVRLFLSLITLLHSKFSLTRNAPENPSFLFFLYGGVGDAILVADLVRKVSRLGDVVVLCDKKVSELSFIMPEKCKVVFYTQHNFIQDRHRIKKEFPDKVVFVHTSPIVELYLVRLILNIRHSIGFISRFDRVHSIGLPSISKHVTSSNFIQRYEQLCHVLVGMWPVCRGSETLDFGVRPANLNVIQNLDHYIVLSLNKSKQWSMGKMRGGAYLKIAEYFILHYNYKIVLVGSEDERDYIDGLIDKSKYSDSLVNIAGKTRLIDLANILNGGDFIISNDNGIAHMAAFLRLKVLVLFMFSDPEVYLWPYKDYNYLFNPIKACMPCVGRHRCPRDNYPPLCRHDLICNRSLNSIQVISKIEQLSWAKMAG